MTQAMTDDDAELVALIDNELDENRKNALLARLETDERLRERYQALRETGARIAASFDALLGQAPVQRLRAGLRTPAALSHISLENKLCATIGRSGPARSCSAELTKSLETIE